jgi:hypothetical protein
VLAKREEKTNYVDCKVIPDECVILQYKFMVVDFYFKICARQDIAQKSREQNDGNPKGTLLKCLKIELL